MKIFLVMAYLSMYGDVSIEKHDFTDQGLPACRVAAKEWVQRPKSGSGSAWCKTVIDGRK